MEKIKVKVINDGKGRYQSYSAYVNINNFDYLVGYGENFEASINDLRRVIHREMQKLKDIDLDFSNVIMVDEDGNELPGMVMGETKLIGFQYFDKDNNSKIEDNGDK